MYPNAHYRFNQNLEAPLNTELIGMISGGLVVLSAIPYGTRTYQRKAKPNITSWALWGVIGFALLVTYKDSGAIDNVWPALFGFTNPCIIAGIGYWRSSTRQPFTAWEKASIAGCLCSLGLWIVLREDKELVQYALYVGLVADLCAAVPTLHFVWTQPKEERPGAWIMFALAYGLGIFAITEHSVANYALPLYMLIAPVTVVYPLIRYRIKAKIPLTQWI